MRGRILTGLLPAGLAPGAALAQSPLPPLTGAAALGDWHGDAPGVQRTTRAGGAARSASRWRATARCW